MRLRPFFFPFFLTIYSLFISSAVLAQGGDVPRLRDWDAPETMRRITVLTERFDLQDCPPELHGTTSTPVPRMIERAGLFEIGRMANTYSMLRDNRASIAHDPKSKQLMVAFRGTDRDTSGDGRSLYVRYARRHGAEWDPPLEDLARGEMPGYPSVLLPHADNAPWPHALMIWSVMTDFPKGASIYGDVRTMKSGVGQDNFSLDSFPLPPNWSVPFEIRMNQQNGDLYTIALGLEPRNGASTGEIYMLRSTDGGMRWRDVSFDNPIFTEDLVPSKYRAHKLRFDISPDGSTMVAAWSGIYTDNRDDALLLDSRHEIQWRISTDKGMSWGPLLRQRVADIAQRPTPFERKIAMTWDIDVVFDYRNRLHFLTVCSSDLDVFDPFAEADRSGRPNPSHVDSTYATEIIVDGPAIRILPIGPVRRIRTERRSFTEADTTGLPYTLRNETKWARNYAGTALYAKWISPAKTWVPLEENGQAYLLPDTLTQIYVNGRHVDTTDGSPWYHRWAFEAPSENPAWRDSLMRATRLADIGAKCTQIARYAGDAGQLHMTFVEWGEGATPDSEPVRGEQIVWYIKDITVPVMNTEGAESEAVPAADALIEQISPHPFSHTTSIRYRLDRGAAVRMHVVDALGRVVLRPVDGFREAGAHSVSIDGAGLPSGTYLVRLESGGRLHARTMLIVR